MKSRAKELMERYIFARKLRIGYKDKLSAIDDLIKVYEEQLKNYGIDIEEMLKTTEPSKQKGDKK